MIKQRREQFSLSAAIIALLQEFHTRADYSLLREQLTRHLVQLLCCRAAFFYWRTNETLQLVASAFDKDISWSEELFSIAHKIPISLHGTVPEARACRDQQTICISDEHLASVVVPLISGQQSIGVLVVVRGSYDGQITAHHTQNGRRTADPSPTLLGPGSGQLHNQDDLPLSWSSEEITDIAAIAGVIALALESRRLREQGSEQVHELSLLNSIGSQLNCSLYEMDRLRSIILQRTKEICAVDLCEMLEANNAPPVSSWISLDLHERLFSWYRLQHVPLPLVIERSLHEQDPDLHSYLALLPSHVQTFIALPLLGTRAAGKQREIPSSLPKVLGMIVGAYCQTWQLRQDDLDLLQVLAGQAGTVMENIQLMAEATAARNESRRLLRQVLDDQHLKELILESIPSGLITTDEEGRISIFNPAASAMLGYDPYEVYGLPLRKILPLADSTALEDQNRQTITTFDRYEQKRVLEVELIPLYDHQKKQIGTLAILNDLTSIHHLQEEKRRLDHLASLGEMAANVAHEVRNPLASIKAAIQMLRADFTPGHGENISRDQESWVRESTAVVLKEVERLDTFVRELLLFARPHQLQRTCCIISDLCNDVLKLIEPQCNAANILIHRLYEPLPALWLDSGQMEQIFLNIFMNAIQAMPKGGILTVSCHCTPDELEIAVTDTGIGIAHEHIDNIFQPFYTTKAHGIGLGLSITKRLVEEHSGSICINSQLGYGATVSIRLPLVTER